MAAFVAVAQTVAAADTGDDANAKFRSEVLPVMRKLCFDCHGGPAMKKDDPVRLDRLDADLVNGPHAETWHEVLNHLNRGEMPPEDEPQPSAAERQRIVDWVTVQLERAAEARRGTGGQVVLRRLTRYEYNNTLRDLLGVDLDFARNLPPEPTSPDGFKNNGAVLGISPLQIEYYLKAAREALAKAIVEGEKPEVFTFETTKSEKNAKKKKGEVDSNRLVTNERFIVRMKEFPRTGTFRVRVHARADVPKD